MLEPDFTIIDRMLDYIFTSRLFFNTFNGMLEPAFNLSEEIRSESYQEPF